MREILFRGKQKDTGEWVYGGYAHVFGLREADGEMLPDACLLFPEDFNSDYSYYQSINVDIETVGQYTGLKDKNGVRIFEGDIVTFLSAEWKPIRVVVQWDIESAGFYYGKFSMFHLNTSAVEVIGNIHDNPDLLAEVGKMVGGEE